MLTCVLRRYPLEYGPEGGEVGMRKNIESAKKWREACGPDFPLMLDCYMALDVQYAATLAKRLEPVANHGLGNQLECA